MKKTVPPAPLSNSNIAELQCERLDVGALRPAARQIRSHSAAKIETLSALLKRQGQLSPIIINSKNVIIDGHARWTVAKDLGWTTVMVIQVEHLSDDELRLYCIAANKLPTLATVNVESFRIELEELQAGIPNLDLTLTGYSVPEIDTARGLYRENELNDLSAAPIPPTPRDTVSRLGDVFRCGSHLVICGSALDENTYAALMEDGPASLVFTDSPYKVRVNGHVSGNGQIKHREFAMASGEMDRDGFKGFLRAFMTNAVANLGDGGLAFCCMDHAHLGELLEVGDELFSKRLQICVWDKGRGGMGAFYRSRHELVVLFKKGSGKHINNIRLGKYGRDRTNIWSYPGMAGAGRGARARELHPTVKPVSMVADALLDASPTNGVVLDPFGGSGTTMIAAEKTGRRARLIELDPAYVDVIVKRFEELTGAQATHAATGLTFAGLAQQRSSERTAAASLEDAA